MTESSSFARVRSCLLDSRRDKFGMIFDVVIRRLMVRGSMVGASHDLDEAIAFAALGKVCADIEMTATTRAALSG